MQETKQKEIGLVTILLYNSKNELLLMKRANEPFKGMWSLPGGKIDPNELPADAIKREVFEELGIRLNEVNYLDSEKYTSPGLARVYVFECSITDAQTYTPNEREVQDIVWAKEDNIGTYDPFPPNHLEIILKYRKTAAL